MGVFSPITACAGTLYVSFDTTGNKVGTYDSVSGGVLNASFITGLNNPYGLAVDGGNNLFISGIGSSTYKIGKYNATSGATINASLVTGANAINIIVSGTTIYAARYGNNVVSTYNATTGALISTYFISGLSNPRGLALDTANNVLYVANFNASGTTGTVGKYNATTGAVINASFITGLSGAFGLALDGQGNLFVVNSNTAVIGKYNASTGAAVNATFITEPAGSLPCHIAIYGTDLFVTNYSTNTIGKFNSTTGAGSASFITGLSKPIGITLANATADTVPIAGLTSKIIRVPTGATQALIDTANELAAKLNDITSTTAFTVQTNSYTAASGPSPGIVLGTGTHLNMLNELPDPTSPYAPKKREDYQICTENNNSYIFLAGTTELAIRHAAYDFLNQLGCRWYFAGSHWIITPDAPSLTWTTAPRLRTKNVTMGAQGSISMKVYNEETPDFKMRNFAFGYMKSTGDWSQNYNDVIEWRKGNRLDNGLFIAANHSYGTVDLDGAGPQTNSKIAGWANTQTPNQWSPNYWSLLGSIDGINGTRTANTQFGVSNVGNEANIHTMVANYVTNYFAANPAADSVSLEPNDGDNWCQCAACQLIQPITVNPTTGAGYGAITNRVVYFANKAAVALPTGKYVAYYAYNTHSPIPTGQDPGNPAIPLAPDSRTYVLVATRYTMGVPGVTRVKQWSNAFPNLNIGIRDYLDGFIWSKNLVGSYSAAACPAQLSQNLVLYRSYRADVYSTEATNGWGPNGVGYYLAANLLWEGKSDIPSLKSEFLTKCFGAAVTPMTDFYNRIDITAGAVLSDDLLHRLYQDLTDAHALVSAPNPVDTDVQARIDDLTLWLRYTEKYLSITGKVDAALQSALEDLLTFAWKIRVSNVIDSVALWREMPSLFPSFVWPKSTVPPYVGQDMNYALTYAQGNTLKSQSTFSAGDIAQMRTDGITNNPLLPEEAKNFSTDVVPVLGGANALVGNFAGVRYKQSIYMHTNSSGILPILTVTTGYSHAYTANWTLYRANDQTVPLATGTVAPDLVNHAINFADYGTFGKGSYVFVYDDIGATSYVSWPDGALASTAATPQEPVASHSTTWTRYFYVPKGTKNVMLHAGATGAGTRFYDINGALLTNITEGGTNVGDTLVAATAVDIVIPVPPGKDDQIWHVGNKGTGGAALKSNFYGVSGFFFLNTPGYMTASRDSLVVPREAYSNLKYPSLSSSTAGGTATTKGLVHIYVYTDGSNNMPTLTISNGWTTNTTATWNLYREKDSVSLSTGTVPGTQTNTNILGGAPPNIPGSSPAVGSGPCLHLVYDDLGGGSKITWPAGSRVVISANAQEPLPSIATSGSRRYFYVPKGTELIQMHAGSIAAGVKFYTENNTQKNFAQGAVNNLSQTTASTTDVDINIPVSAGQDGQVWYVTDLNATNFSIQGTPGYLATNRNELLVPQWLERQIANGW